MMCRTRSWKHTSLLCLMVMTISLASAIDLCGVFNADVTLRMGEEHTLSCQAFFKQGTTLTIESGVTVRAMRFTGSGKAPALIIERGAKIMANGTEGFPITFTVDAPLDALPARGLWGGIIINGMAPTSHAAGEGEVEGLEGIKYGGNDPEDDSGILRYVRIWYGGAVIGQDNEINGLTLAGVGNGTVVEYIEVAFNLDDGIELFGGTVNLKYIVVLFCGDDAIDTDHGYQGKIKFALVMMGTGAGHHGAEMDSKTDGEINSQPRSHPQLYNALFVGSNTSPSSVSSDDLLPAIMRLREGTGGTFANIIMTNVGNSPGVLQNQCGTEVRTNEMSALNSASFPNFLYFSPNNIINTKGPQNYLLDSTCSGLSQAINADPDLLIMPEDAAENITYFDPRPKDGGSAYDQVDPVPNDGFFSPANYKGAFGKDLWITGWSWLDEDGRIPKI